MFGSKEIIDALDEIKEKLNEQSVQLENQKRETDELKLHVDKKFEHMKTSFMRIETRDSTYFKEIDHQLNILTKLNERYGGSLENLKLIRTGLMDQISDKVEQDVNKQLSNMVERMDADVNRYNELKQNLAGLTNSLEMLKGEINKFNSISKNVKETDFELVKHQRNIESMDRHKLELMQKIEHLERLVGRMRQNTRFRDQ